MESARPAAASEPVSPALPPPPEPGRESATQSFPAPPRQRISREWIASIDEQGRAFVRDCTARGRALDGVDAKTQAVRLLRRFQDDADGPLVVCFATVREEYLCMLDDLGWQPAAWAVVGGHFSRMTGGKKYSSVWNPRTGKKDAKERIYRIPAPARTSARLDRLAEPAVTPAREPVRRAA